MSNSLAILLAFGGFFTILLVVALVALWLEKNR